MNEASKQRARNICKERTEAIMPAISTAFDNAIAQLEDKVASLKNEGVVAIRLFPVDGNYSREERAQGILNLMNGRIVEDSELF